MVLQPTSETCLVESMAARQLGTQLSAIFVLSSRHLLEADMAVSFSTRCHRRYAVHVLLRHTSLLRLLWPHHVLHQVLKHLEWI